MATQTTPVLVGHRGWPAHYPENSLEGFAAAVAAGARWLECDVQLSADRVPFVCHDVSLARTAGLDLDITQTLSQKLQATSVGEPARFGQRFAGVRLPRLSQLVEWITTQDGITQFVEIKRQSLRHHGTAPVVTAVMQTLQSVLAHCVVISFDHACLELAREQGAQAIGWAVEHVTPEVQNVAAALRPEYLFTDEKLFARINRALPGPWQWIVYHTENAERALELTRAGAHLVETNDIGTLLRDPRLAPE
ncbi:MAG: glycerophosphodiester phosphodiesterase family protein [Gammaproteobacteria bacterium]